MTNYKIGLKKISINDLARWSPWPSRLLSIDPFKIRNKTPTEVTREFGDEKWGTLLSFFNRQDLFELSDVEAMEQNLSVSIPCYDHNHGFYLTSAKEANDQQINIYRDALKTHVSGASGLVELGAGYGSKILRLSKLSPFNHLPLYAAEYTRSGCDLIKLIGKMTNNQIEVGRCDFNSLDISAIKIPENSVIFTSYSVHYVPELRQGFVNFINKFKPKVVVHFEPCYEHYDDQTLHGLMCKRYMELNGYTKNIASSLQAGCSRIGAKFEVERNVFGSNPFLPHSIVKWTPNE